jgi:hypothetical protein
MDWSTPQASKQEKEGKWTAGKKEKHGKNVETRER